MVNFKVGSKDEVMTINRIAHRASSIAASHGIKYDVMTADMDITACHSNGCPLDLAELEKAKEFDFTHDVFGIRRHIDRDTGKLRDCFVPRYAARVAA